MRRFLHGCLVVVLGSGVLVARDIVVFKSGQRYIGTIEGEDATNIFMYFEPSIKLGPTKIPKSDIKEIIHLTPAQVEFEERGLNKLIPTRDLMTASDYDSIIENNLRTFEAKHPGTPEAKDVHLMIAILEDERTKVLSGQIKVEGSWLDEATAKREAYSIGAYRLRVAMRDKAADTSNPNNLLEALREFDTLEKNYPASLHYHQAIPEVLEILEKHDRRLLAMSAEQPVRLSTRDAGLRTLQGPDLERARAAIDLEEREFQARLDAQVKNQTKWRDVHTLNLRSIQDAQRAVATEREVLKEIDLAALKRENTELGEVMRLMADGLMEEARAALKRLPEGKAVLINRKTVEELEERLGK